MPEGFAAVTLRVTDADGHVHESCVLVADDDAKRAHGLMDVDSLGGYDGMIFRFSDPTSSAFYMYRTRLPLSIAFLDASGGLVSATDMAPCTAKSGDDCPLYNVSGKYVDALGGGAGRPRWAGHRTGQPRRGRYQLHPRLRLRCAVGVQSTRRPPGGAIRTG